MARHRDCRHRNGAAVRNRHIINRRSIATSSNRQGASGNTGCTTTAGGVIGNCSRHISGIGYQANRTDLVNRAITNEADV